MQDLDLQLNTKNIKTETMKQILFLLALTLASFSFGQEKKTTEEILIKTNAECGTCKKKLEEVLNYTKGVKYAELDLKTKQLTVAFSTKKISADQIRSIISETGYDADDVPANPSSQNQLPICCQPGGHK